MSYNNKFPSKGLLDPRVQLLGDGISDPSSFCLPLQLHLNFKVVRCILPGSHPAEENGFSFSEAKQREDFLYLTLAQLP